ncbi:MAG: hypothetical protein QXH91_08945, partial [Candidatus Bathyarchaeia archaeon]
NLAVIFQQDILKAGYLKGEIYYQAFLPKPEWRNIKHRPIQPIELRIIQPPYTFSYQEEKINSQGDFVYEAFTRSFQTIQDLNEILRSRENWQTNTIFLYVSPETTYETILSWYQHLASRYPIIYLFIE